MTLPQTLLRPLSHYRRHLLRGRLRRLRSGSMSVWFILGFGTACIVCLAPEQKARERLSHWKSHKGCLASQAWHCKPMLDRCVVFPTLLSFVWRLTDLDVTL